MTLVARMNLAATGSVFPLAEMAADKFPFEPFVPKTFRFVLGTFLVSRRLKLSLKLQKRDTKDRYIVYLTLGTYGCNQVRPKISPRRNCQAF